MQFAISGTYQGGQIILNEQPLIDNPSKRKQQLGILADFKADPEFYEPFDKDELEQW